MLIDPSYFLDGDPVKDLSSYVRLDSRPPLPLLVIDEDLVIEFVPVLLKLLFCWIKL